MRLRLTTPGTYRGSPPSKLAYGGDPIPAVVPALVADAVAGAVPIAVGIVIVAVGFGIVPGAAVVAILPLLY